MGKIPPLVASVQGLALLPGGTRLAGVHPVFRATHEGVQAFWKTKGDPQAAEAGRKELARYLPVLESALADVEWEFSLADVAYVPHLALDPARGTWAPCRRAFARNPAFI